MQTPGGPLVCLECRERFASSRGLCRRCYQRLNWQVRTGKTTWAKLEKAGRARPKAGRWAWDWKPK